MAAGPYISRSTRGAFRSLMTGHVFDGISQAFLDERFSPDQNCAYEDSSVRRKRTEEFLSAIDWDDPETYPRVIRVFQRLLPEVRPDGIYPNPTWDSFVRLMDGDGWVVTDDGHISPKHKPLLLAPDALAQLQDPSAIHEQLDRLRRAANSEDPAFVIGSAKELVETTAKVVLAERGLEFDRTWKFPNLISEAQDALRLRPNALTEGPDTTPSVKRVLGGAQNMVLGLDELRNAGYGTGHGPARVRVGLHPRHARLAANAAVTWCELMLDTLTDQAAPWRDRAD